MVNWVLEVSRQVKVLTTETGSLGFIPGVWDTWQEHEGKNKNPTSVPLTFTGMNTHKHICTQTALHTHMYVCSHACTTHAYKHMINKF